MNCDICNRIQNNNKLMQIKQYTEDAVSEPRREGCSRHYAERDATTWT